MSKVAVVTGGAGGMGRAVSRHLAEAGHAVAVLDIDGVGAKQVAEDLRAGGAKAIACEVDVTDQAAVDEGLRTIRSELGPIAIMVTTAGLSKYEAATEIGLESWNQILASNLTGTFLCIQGVIPEMVSAGWGRIVTISSAAGQWGTARMASYSAAKGGVIALTKALAREYASSGITVNSVPPGVIDTPMFHEAQDGGNLPSDEILVTRVPVGRVGTPDNIAATCAFLCTEDAGYITGQVVAVNGGLVI
jgi:2-hydroxycyclohexanecarboxyl-CoA dehydrogenase